MSKARENLETAEAVREWIHALLSRGDEASFVGGVTRVTNHADLTDEQKRQKLARADKAAAEIDRDLRRMRSRLQRREARAEEDRAAGFMSFQTKLQEKLDERHRDTNP